MSLQVRSLVRFNSAGSISAAFLAVLLCGSFFCEEPGMEGLETNRSVVDSGREITQDNRSPSDSADFRRFPSKEPETDTEREELRVSLDAFLNDPGNAGLSDRFLGRFPANLINELQSQILDHPEVHASVAKLGISTQMVQALEMESESLNKPFTLGLILKNFPGIFSHEKKNQRIQFFQEIWERLEKLSMDYKDSQKSSFQDEFGKAEQRTLPEELLDRLNFLIKLGSNSMVEIPGDGDLTILYLISWFGRVPANQIGLISSKELDRTITFDVPGGSVRGGLGSVASKMHPFYYQEVLPVSKMVSEEFLPLFESKIKPALERDLQREENLAAQARSFARQSYALKGWERSRNLWLKELNTVLTSQGHQPLDESPGSAQALQERFENITASMRPEKRQRALKALKEVTRANLVLARLSSQASANFKNLYARYKTKIEEHGKRIEGIANWILEFNRTSSESYSVTVMKFANQLGQSSRLSRLDVAFQAVTSRCLFLFPSENLQSMAVRTQQDVQNLALGFSLPVDTQNERRLVCLADYELNLREAHPASENEPFLGDGIRDLNLKMGDFLRSAKGRVLKEDPRNPAVSLFSLAMDFFSRKEEWVPEGYDEIMTHEAQALQWALSGKLVLEQIPAADTHSEVLQLGQGVVHNFSAQNYFEPTELLWRNPVEGELFQGAWLGVMLGDSWLRTREPEQKGQGLSYLLKSLEPYLGPKGVRAYLVQMSMRNKHNSQAGENAKPLDAQTPGVFPTSIPISNGNRQGRIGIGYGLKSEPGQARPVLAQVKVNSLLHWEGVGDFALEPRHDFRHIGKNGPIYQIYFPLYFLEIEPGDEGKFRISREIPPASEWKRALSARVQTSRTVFGYQNDKVSRIHFGDVLYFHASAIVDGSGAPLENKTSGIHVFRKDS